MPPTTIREEKLGKLTLRLLKTKVGYTGIILPKASGVLATLTGVDPDEVWRRLVAEAGKYGNEYVGYDGARARFLRFCPDGFAAGRYVEEERNYKVKARDKLTSTVPLEQVASGSGFGPQVRAVFGATNLLVSYEQARVGDVMSSLAADPFVRAAARFTLDVDEQALAEMVSLVKPFGTPAWPILTYLPFLWRPETHMFLKPEVTKMFAGRVGHRFVHDYADESKPRIAIYRSLLGLVEETEQALADLLPRDRIDVQGFIWVVGEYDEAHNAPQQKASG